MRRLDSLLREAELDGIVILATSSSDADLSSFLPDGRLGECFLLVPRGEAPRLGYLTPMEREEAARSGLDLLLPESLGVSDLRRRAPGASLLPEATWRGLEQMGMRTGRLGVAGSPRAAQLLELERRMRAEGLGVVGAGEVLLRWRKAKSEWQLLAIRGAARGALEGLRAVSRLLAGATMTEEALIVDGEMLSVRRLEQEIARLLAERGLEQPEGWIVAAGADAGVPHSRSDPERILEAGEPVLVDLFPRGRLFADSTRTMVVGEPAPEVRRAHATIRAVLREAEAAAVPGASAKALQHRACAIFAEAGYPTIMETPEATRGYVHTLGHGVGCELHELPSFRADGADGTLAVGDVFTLEPGLYDPESGWGVRIENLYWLGPEGLENLTPLPYDLDPAAWDD